ncbi:MAG TPA: glycosyltransferase [Roseiflexaceae bacterium]|nr:glycosyltransferase [Roseiflexaceae bacterium]
MSPLVSVIIPCYNYAGFLPDAVGSVLAQTCTDWELIVVDDGSTDATLSTAQQLMARHPERRIRLFQQPNAGPAAARNTGAERAAGEYLLFLDADDMLAPTLLEQTVATLREQPAVGFVYSGMRLFGQDHHEWPSVPFDLALLTLDNYVLPHALVRRAAWAEVGGFDTAQFPYGFEDWDFWLRVAAAGWQGWHIAAPLVAYRRHGPSLSAAGKDHEWDARARIIRKHPQLYGPRLVAWAIAYCARHPLPDPTRAAGQSDVRELQRSPMAAAGGEPAPLSEQPPAKVSLARRLIRTVPFDLRFRVKCWRRRAQLGLRAAFPWLYL